MSEDSLSFINLPSFHPHHPPFSFTHPARMGDLWDKTNRTSETMSCVPRPGLDHSSHPLSSPASNVSSALSNSVSTHLVSNHSHHMSSLLNILFAIVPLLMTTPFALAIPDPSASTLVSMSGHPMPIPFVPTSPPLRQQSTHGLHIFGTENFAKFVDETGEFF